MYRIVVSYRSNRYLSWSWTPKGLLSVSLFAIFFFSTWPIYSKLLDIFVRICLSFFLCIFSVIPMCRFSSLRATACLVRIYPWGYTLYTELNSFKSLNFDFLSLIGVSDSEVFIVLILNLFFSLNSCKN